METQIGINESSHESVMLKYRTSTVEK